MTTGKVTQAGAEMLHRVTPNGRITQAGIEYLHRVGTPASVTQAGVEYLHRVIPVFSVTQAGVEYLHKDVPCGTQLAQIWTIERTDGEVFRFTSLDRPLEWPPGSGVEYRACDSLVPSAAEAVAGTGSFGSMDLSGAVADVLGAVSQHDLQAGLFDGASFEGWLVPWQGVDVPRLLQMGTFGEVEHGERGFSVEVVGDGARLTQTPLVSTLGPGCKYRFGDDKCTKDLAPLTVTGTVDNGLGQRAFTDAARAEAAGYFTRGVVTFTSGDNAGVSAEIKQHGSGGEFLLWPRVPYVIQSGSTYSMVPGCTNLKDSDGGTNGCDAWDNYVNYPGFLFVAGGDAAHAAADVRTQ